MDTPKYRIRSSLKVWLVLVGAIFVLGGRAWATVLIFNLGPLGVDNTPMTGMFQNYGDRAIETPTPPPASFEYLEGPGWTPNVVVDYGPGLRLAFSADQGDITKQYGDLHHVLYRDDTGGDLNGIMQITLTADPGTVVNLLSFDLAAIVGHNITIGGITITDEHNAVLFNKSSPTITGGTFQMPAHDTFIFDGLPAHNIIIQSNVVRITINMNCSGPPVTDQVAIDNIIFGQTPPLPAPGVGALVLIGFGVMGGGVRRVRG